MRSVVFSARGQRLPGVKVLLIFCFFVLSGPYVFADSAKVESMLATKFFDKTQKEKNPRLAMQYLEQARIHAEAALSGDLGRRRRREMKEIVELSEKFPAFALETEFKRAVVNKIIIKWLKKSEVRACLGNPETVAREPFSRKEKWIYSDGRVMFFEDEYLVEIKNAEKIE